MHNFVHTKLQNKVQKYKYKFLEQLIVFSNLKVWFQLEGKKKKRKEKKRKKEGIKVAVTIEAQKIHAES